jgi:hypothetical protein
MAGATRNADDHSGAFGVPGCLDPLSDKKSDKFWKISAPV